MRWVTGTKSHLASKFDARFDDDADGPIQSRDQNFTIVLLCFRQRRKLDGTNAIDDDAGTWWRCSELLIQLASAPTQRRRANAK